MSGHYVDGKRSAYRVIANMAVVRVPNAMGGEVYLKRGQRVPTGASPWHVEHLLELGVIEEVTA